jgi:Ca-activated chloride channel family protein
MTESADRLVDPRLTIRPDRRLVRANGRSQRYLLVEVVAPTVASDRPRKRPPVNLAFVLDRSGSMGAHAKLPLAKQATLEAIDRLDAADRFAVVTYDERVEVVMAGSEATPSNRQFASRELATVEPRGSTNLHAGWLTGCEQVAAGLVEQGVNRVLLLTDGLANAGIIDRDELGRLAFDLRRRGVTTSTFGVGVDFDESLLQAMADNGGGHFYFAGDVAQMRDHITSEVGETLEVVAREVVLELVLPENVRVDSLSPFRVEQAGGRARILLGDMVSGQVLTIALRLGFDFGTVGHEVGALIRVSDRDRAFEAAEPALAPVSLAWTYADTAANDAEPRDVAVDRVVAGLYAERVRQEAVRLNREGRFEEARLAVEGVRQRVAGYAGRDPELNAIVAALQDEQVTYAAPMPEMARKSVHYAASLACRMRTPEGKSKRA